MKSSLNTLPGIGKSIAQKLNDIGIYETTDLLDQDPQALYDRSNSVVGNMQDKCLLYTFRCAVYVANTPPKKQQPNLLKRRNRK